MLKKLIYTIISFITAIGAASCADDGLGIEGGGEMREYRGTLEFDLTTPDASDRTRSLNTGAGATVQVANLWLGVFDINTGQCFGAYRNDNFNTTMASGSLVKNIIKVDFIAKGTSVPLAYIVAVANYDGVRTHDGRALTDILPDFDNRGNIDWEKVKELGIDTESAYAGKKGADANANAPFMAGFYQDAVSLSQNPKIDQFADGSEQVATLYPQSAADGSDIGLGDPESDKTFVAAGAICLRRLVSHNVLRFNMSNGYELTSVKYKRHNMPRAVYMLQRRTDTNRHNSFEEWQRYSPNLADHLLKEGSYDISDPAFPYETDTDWNEVGVATWQNAAEIEIAFEHFENKHWGFGNLQTQEDREARNPDGTFKALCTGAGDDYNNFASYFTLGLHIINKETGESADVEYTLHEGFCNTDDGRTATTLPERCHDFGSFRNVNYNYNINIAGISDITASVTSGEDRHAAGQTGSIWKMEFANGDGTKAIPTDGGDFNFNGGYMSFSGNPDLGYRIYGVEGNGNVVDICYNMPDGMYEGFSGIWPTGTPTYTDSPDAGVSSQMLQGMTVVNRNSGISYTLPEFIKGINNSTLSPTGQYLMRFTAFNGKEMDLVENVKRGIFLFDRNDVRNASDYDGCSRYNVAFGALQNSLNFEKIYWDINDHVVWDNTYYKAVSDGKATVYAATAPIFYGAELSTIDMRWKHDSRFQGYEITVFNDSYTAPTVVVGPTEVKKYLKQVNGQTIFVYPYNTSKFPRRTSAGANNYSFRVVPITDPESYLVEGKFEVIHKQNGTDDTCVRVCYPIYEFNSNGSNDWKTLLPLKDKTIDAHYRGLTAYTPTPIGNYSSLTFWCYGKGGNVNEQYFSFVAAVPGKFKVVCNSHSGNADATRALSVVSIDREASQASGTIVYQQVYNSGTMPGSKSTFTTSVLPLLNDEPTEFRIFAGGSIDYYSIEFIPN